MLSLVVSTTAYGPSMAPVQTVQRAATPQMGFGKAELEALAKEQNPVLGFWDPIGLSDIDLWGQGTEASIAWIRHAEIKHGRIAMAGFVGFMAAANYENIGAPMRDSMFPTIGSGLSAPEVWDAIPFLAKLQIVGAIGALEHISEDKNFLAADGMSHYMRGGKPGYFPTFAANVHPCPLNLWDPFGFTKNLTAEQKAKDLNPVIGFWDPLNLASGEFWGDSNAATIGFLQESEIKHGRVAMAGFVGYIVHANGIRFPYAGPWDSIPADISPQAQWDALPEAGKWQIILTIGFFEFWRENAYVLSSEGQSHYMRGGKPGYFPTFDQLPHPVPFNLFDPFGFTKSASAEKKAKSLIAEVNNGRLAMIGLMGFLAESKVPGSVPALSGIVKSYDGNVMAPFDANFHIIG
jgi:hypothetical protein